MGVPWTGLGLLGTYSPGTIAHMALPHPTSPSSAHDPVPPFPLQGLVGLGLGGGWPAPSECPQEPQRDTSLAGACPQARCEGGRMEAAFARKENIALSLGRPPEEATGWWTEASQACPPGQTPGAASGQVAVGTCGQLREPPWRIYSRRLRGVCRRQNQASKEAQGRWVMAWAGRRDLSG